MVNQTQVIAATGHRPDKLGGYNKLVDRNILIVATMHLKLNMPRVVISGMALGWDQAVAEAAINLKIPFVAALPFAGQEGKWPGIAKKRYRDLLQQAERVDVVSPGYFEHWKMQKRNEWMVDHCTELMALWDGSYHGGTAHCLDYATRRGVPFVNLWDNYQELV